MVATEYASENVSPAGIWTRLKCGGASCRFMREYPGPPQARDLAQCPLCGSPVQAVTVFRV